MLLYLYTQPQPTTPTNNPNQKTQPLLQKDFIRQYDEVKHAKQAEEQANPVNRLLVQVRYILGKRMLCLNKSEVFTCSS